MDQWLKTGTVKKKHNMDMGQSSRISQDTSNTLVQSSEKARSAVLRTGKRRKYCDEYMKYEFSFTGDEDCPKPQCVVRGEVLSSGCMKPPLLLRH